MGFKDKHGMALPVKCDFCILHFKTVSERESHITAHFNQKHCTACNKSLVQIGRNWYKLEPHIDEECEAVKDIDGNRMFEDQSKETHFNEEASTSEDINGVSIVCSVQPDIILQNIKTEEIETPENCFIEISRLPELSSEEEEFIDNIVDDQLPQDISKIVLENDYRFWCKICHERFTILSEHKKHVNELHDGREFQCPHCDKCYTAKAKLKQHWQKFHKNFSFEDRYDKTKTYITPQNIKTEEIETPENPFIEISCLPELSSEEEDNIVDDQLPQDISKIELENDYRFWCKICYERFSVLSEHKKHVTEQHDGREFKCLHCDKCYTAKAKLKEHWQKYHRYFSFEDRYDKTKNLQNIKTVKVPESSSQSKAKSVENLVGDIRTAKKATEILKLLHANRYKFWCKMCFERFAYLEEHHRHVQEQHNGKEFKCPHCGKCFTTKYKSQEHIDTAHLKRLFTCDICNSQLKSKFRLVAHMATHINNGQGIHKCTFCNRSFLTRRSLTSHLKRMHEDVAPTDCDVCGKTFRNKICMEAHKKHHIEEPSMSICNVCGQSFRKKYRLEIHLRIHSDEKPFICEVCKKGFKQYSQLYAHKRIHTGERPYKCNQEGCDRAYINGVDLIRHKYSVHRIFVKKHICQICSKVFPLKGMLRKHLDTHPAVD